MDWKTFATILVTLTVAVLGYFFNLWNSEQKGRLERVNRQLSELYGPLFALTRAADMAWRAFRSKYRRNKPSFFASDPPPTPEEEKAWRLWMVEVFMPLNLRMQNLVVEKSDLLIGREMPECLLTLCAHVATYKTVLKRWESGDFSEMRALVNFPGEAMLSYTDDTFRRLKEEQTNLLGYRRFVPRSAQRRPGG